MTEQIAGVYYAMQPVAIAQPTVRKSVSVGALRAALSTNQAGFWASDHRAEIDKYAGWHYVAIRATALQAAQATVCVYDDSVLGNAAKLRRAEMRRMFGSVLKTQAATNEPAAKQLPSDHRLVKLFKRPNPSQSGATFRYEQVLQLGLTGTILIVKIPNRVGQTVERYVVPTAIACPKPPCREYPRGGYYINPAAASAWSARMDAQGFVNSWGFDRLLGMTFPVEQFIIIRWPHPILKSDGQSPVSASALWTDTAEMIDRSRHSHLKQGPDPSLVVTAPEGSDPTEDELDRAAVKFNQKYSGTNNHGKAIFMAGGEVTELGTSPRDMVYDLGFTQMRDSTLAIHGVPPLAAGITSATGREGLYAPLLQFSLLTVQPMLNIMAEEETIQQAAEFGENLTVEFEAMTVDDPELLEQTLQTDIAAGSRTKNEVRDIRGLPRVAWGEAIAGSGASIHLNNTQPQSGNQVTQQQSTGGVDPNAAENALNDAQITAAVDVMNQVHSGNLSSDAGIELLVAVGIDRQRASGMIQSNSDLPGGSVNGGGSYGGGNGQQQSDSTGGEFGDTSRLQWKRNIKAIGDVIDGLQSGKFSETMSVVMLTSLGLSQANAQRLIDDAKDGTVDDPENSALLGDEAAARNGKSYKQNGHKLNGHSHNGNRLNGHSDDDWMTAAVKAMWRK